MPVVIKNLEGLDYCPLTKDKGTGQLRPIFENLGEALLYRGNATLTRAEIGSIQSQLADALRPKIESIRRVERKAWTSLNQ